MVREDLIQLKEGMDEFKALVDSDFNSSDMYTTVLKVGLWNVIQILGVEDYLVLGQRFEKGRNVDYLLLQFQNEQAAKTWQDRIIDVLKDCSIMPERCVDYQSFLKSFSSAPGLVKWPVKWDEVELIRNNGKSEKCSMVFSKMNGKHSLRFNFFDDSIATVLFISDIRIFELVYAQINGEWS